MSRSGTTSGRAHRRIDPSLVIVLASLVVLLAVLRTFLEVGATALVLGVAGMVGAVVGAVTRPHDHRHGLLLLAVMIGPTIALGRWMVGAYGVIWLTASGAGAIAGRSRTEVARDT